MGYAKAVREACGLQFLGVHCHIKWAASSPDLNVIEKVWRWIKARINEMEPFPTSLAELKAAVQDLWDLLDPYDPWLLREIELMPKKIRAVIESRGLATKY
jgi:hypothetical protein